MISPARRAEVVDALRRGAVPSAGRLGARGRAHAGLRGRYRDALLGAVGPGLQFVELGVEVTRGDQLVVRAVFGDLLIGEH
jgi:hypothetical protein